MLIFTLRLFCCMQCTVAMVGYGSDFLQTTIIELKYKYNVKEYTKGNGYAMVSYTQFSTFEILTSAFTRNEKLYCRNFFVDLTFSLDWLTNRNESFVIRPLNSFSNFFLIEFLGCHWHWWCIQERSSCWTGQPGTWRENNSATGRDSENQLQNHCIPWFWWLWNGTQPRFSFFFFLFIVRFLSLYLHWSVKE